MQQFFSLLSWRLFTAQHVSGYFPLIIRSWMNAVAASGFTFVSWWQSCCVRGQSRTRVANSSSVSQDVLRTLWTRKVHHHVQKRPSPVPLLSQINLVHALPLIFWRSISISYSLLSLGLQSGLFPTNFFAKSLYEPLHFPHRSAVQNPRARDFLDPSRPTRGSTHPIQRKRRSFPGVKWPGREADQSPRSSVEVKKRLEPYYYSTYMLSWRREQKPYYFYYMLSWRREQKPYYFCYIIFQLFWSSYTRFIYFIVKLMRCNIKICKTYARGWYSLPKHATRLSVLSNKNTRH